MEDNINHLKKWLGTGSINIFGIAFSGKDTVGKQLADKLEASFLSSGDIIRQARETGSEKVKAATTVSDSGVWMPTDEFRELVLPYLYGDEIAGKPLVLSMVGRWIGEEGPVLESLNKGNHPIKAVVVLNLSEKTAWQRRELALDPNSRNQSRLDDTDAHKVQSRFDDFKEKTLPVIEIYKKMGLIIEIDGEQNREKVFSDVVNKLYEFSLASASQ